MITRVLTPTRVTRPLLCPADLETLLPLYYHHMHDICFTSWALEGVAQYTQKAHIYHYQKLYHENTLKIFLQPMNC